MFAFLTDFSNHQRIFSVNLETKQVSCGPVGVGSKMSCVSSFLGKRIEEHFIVTSYKLNDHIEKKSLPGSSIPTSDIIKVKAVKEGTEITMTVYGEPSGFLKLAAPLIKFKVDKILSKDMINLKRILESDSLDKRENTTHIQLSNELAERDVETVV